MTKRELHPGIFDVSVDHADLKFFDRLMPTSKGTTYNSFPVSYTHLDVYKRQELTVAEFRAKTLRLGVASVSGTTHTFLMCHMLILLKVCLLYTSRCV